ncbi:hypothetical protein VSVS05_00447 [Vibrio scophthalmi]|uniref:Uncharacterized protein n=1 Tax=Vibrio scophthalmi TaxID=45658 RepID=A0A1C7F8F7_9VIBR|nr:hypothetical protein VSVS05_00447 [Vibrio scophthalmi]
MFVSNTQSVIPRVNDERVGISYLQRWAENNLRVLAVR